MTDVFINKTDHRAAPSLPVGTLMRRKATAGEIGIEIECEGNSFRKQNLPGLWTYHKDGSLRGNDNAEYVLEKPVMFSQVKEQVDGLWAMFKYDGTKLDESNRTSVHVHLNVQKFHLNRLACFAGMFFSVESILTEWCGDHRVGNLFCLRAKDAPNIVTQLKSFIRQEGVGLSDGLHYAGFNVQAMAKFGSIEIRSLRGVTDPTLILAWVRVLQRIYELSAEYPDPRTLVETFSGTGPVEYLKNILGPEYHTVRQGVELTDPDIIHLLYEGIRIAQELCYCRDWSDFVGLNVKTDPFRRDERKIAMKLDELENGPGMGPWTGGILEIAPADEDDFGHPDDFEDDEPEPEYDPEEDEE